MRRSTAILWIAALSSAAAVATAEPTSSAKKGATARHGIGFVTAWSGPGKRIIFDVRWRSDGMTVARYRGEHLKGKVMVPFKGVLRGKTTATKRTLRNGFGYITLPKVDPTVGSAPKSGLGTKPVVWGGGKDGLDFRLNVQSADVSLAAFDVPLVGFELPPKSFDKPILFRDVAVSPLGNGFNGIVISRKVAGKRSVVYAMKTSQTRLKMGTLKASPGKGLVFSGAGDRPSAKVKAIISKLKFEPWKVQR